MGDMSMREERALMAEIRAGLVLAAPRDASWYSSAPTGSGPRSHCGGRYHAVSDKGSPRCNSAALLVLDLAKPPGQVAEVLLCRRPACQAQWRRAS